MRILLVDDQRSARLVMKKMLAGIEDVELLEAGNAAEALAAVSQSSPDLLLLDIRLSSDPRDRGGLDLLRQIRGSGNVVPAVMVTSLTELSQIREAMRSGRKTTFSRTSCRRRCSCRSSKGSVSASP